MTAPLWLCLARVGESSPHAVEASFSAGQREKWERVADHILGGNLMRDAWSKWGMEPPEAAATHAEAPAGRRESASGNTESAGTDGAGCEPASPAPAAPEWPTIDDPYSPTDVWNFEKRADSWRSWAQGEIARLERERDEARQRAEKAEYSARQFCGAHVGLKFSRCPACASGDFRAEVEELRPKVAALEATISRLEFDLATEKAAFKAWMTADPPAERATGADAIYVSGPMTGLPEFNHHAFEAATKQLRALGYTVESPHENAKPDPETWQNWMRLAFAQMLKCRSVATLDNWRASKGARAEVYFAELLGMEVKPLAQWVQPRPAAGGEETR